MRATVVVFPGSNAEAELARTLGDLCGAKTTLLWHHETRLPEGTDIVALPGGFSYGDYVRCGAIAKACPVVPAIREHAARGGNLLGFTRHRRRSYLSRHRCLGALLARYLYDLRNR